MPEVKVRRRGVSADEVTAAIRGRLGDSVQVTPSGDSALTVRKNTFVGARVEMREEPGGTVFRVRGTGVPFPVAYWTTRLINSNGFAKQVTEAIEADESIGGDG